MKTEKITETGVSILGTVVGSMGSRVVANQIPLKDSRVKHGVLALAGVVGAALLNRKDSTEAIIQDIAIGFGATQIGSLVKELVGEQEGALKTALGNPYANNFLGKPMRLGRMKKPFLAASSYDLIPSGYVNTEASETHTEVSFRQS